MLRLTGNDSQLSSTSDLTVTVQPPSGAPLLTSVVPNAGQQGQSGLAVTITGQNTQFIQGTTTASFGAGITVDNVTVTSATSLTAVISIAANAALGGRTVTVTTGTESASLSNGFTVQPVAPVNAPPVVSAGADQTIAFSSVATLYGVATDDGFPSGSLLTVSWSKVSGPGVVMFSSPNGVVTQASFSATGTYVIRLTASDSLLTTSSDATVYVDPCLTGKEEGVRIEGAGIGDFVRLADGRLRMYVGTASFISSDGISWATESEMHFVPTADVGGVAYVRVVTLADGTYRMYFMGDYVLRNDESLWRIYSATSSDGLHWSQEPGIRIDIGGPSGCVNIGVPEILQLPDGLLRMYYSCSRVLATTGGEILSATSSNGLDWTQDPGVRIAPGAESTGGLDNPHIQILPDGTYRMFYGAFVIADHPYPGLTFSARSTDGLNWTVEPGVRLSTGPTGSLDSRRTTGLKLVALGDSTYRAYYQGVDDSRRYNVLSAKWCSVEPNNQPAVNAGADRVVTLPTNSVGLNGSASDDGIPANGTLSYFWKVVSGPGEVVFAAPSSTSTDAQFTAAGGYRLRLMVGDSELFTYDDVAVTVLSTASPSILSVLPGSALQGSSRSVVVTGQNTHFAQGSTTVSFGPGITVTAVTVENATRLTAEVIVAADAATGQRTVTATTGTEVVSWNGFSIVPGTPAVISVLPVSGQQGQSFPVTIVGSQTHFTQGSTQVSFGGGITVNDVTVTGATSLTANISIAANATFGARAVTVTTGSEVATLANGFAVGGATTPVLTQVVPASGQQGQGGPVTIVGQNTSFAQGVTHVDMGPGITISAITVTCPTCLEVQVTIADTAPTGPRTVTVTTGTEVAILASGFTVQPGVPLLTAFAPISGRQAETLSLSVTGRFTSFSEGTTSVNLGPDVITNSVNVVNATSLTAQVSIAATAALGTRTLTVTTGTEVVSVTDVFTVTAAATLTRIDLTPAGTVTLTKGQTVQFSARGTFSDNSVQDPLAGVTWNSAPTSVASISTSGLATGVAPGIANILAARSGIQSAPTSFVVMPLPVGIFGPIFAGSTVVDGAAAEPGASVQVFVSGLPRGPTTVADGAGQWSISGLAPALATGDSVTARQTVNGVQSDSSTAIIVGPGHADDPFGHS